MKLFTMDMVDQQKVEEYVYEMALQVLTDCLSVSAPCGSIRQPVEAAAGLWGRSQWSMLQQRFGTLCSSSGSASNGMPSVGYRRPHMILLHMMCLAGDSMQKKHPLDVLEPATIEKLVLPEQAGCPHAAFDILTSCRT